MIKDKTSEFKKFTPKNLPAFEALASGHRACQGCGEIIALRLAMKAAGEDVIVVNATGCMEVVTTPWPQTSWRVPWMHVAFENAAAVGSGVEAARKAMARKGMLPADDKTKVVIVGGDGGTFDIGFQALSGALERGQDITYLCLDNEAYMNTGVQRSSATPWGAWTTTSPCMGESSGKKGHKKDIIAIVAAHDVPYVATASPAYYLDLMNKVQKAVNTPGPAFIHMFSPCPTGWRMQPQDSMKLAKLAVQTKMYPLFEVVNGQFELTNKPAKFKPVSEYLKMQGRYRHLSDEQIAVIQTRVNEKYEALEQRAGLVAV
jgi:pyruvate ferredoxin oxidoreductase beta subunit